MSIAKFVISFKIIIVVCFPSFFLIDVKLGDTWGA